MGAAIVLILMIMATAAGVFKAISGAVTHETMTLTDRWGRNPVVVGAFSPIWWVLLITCLGALGYCGYLLVQLVRRQS